MSVQIIFDNFPYLTEKQKEQFILLEGIYSHWNAQINVISRKDTENFYERHVLHSLGIAKVASFAPNTTVLDIGTGGGFPGIPLAILFPETTFTLVDSIGKKIKVVNEVASAIGLKNVSGIHARAEELKESFDFIVSRAVTAMPVFLTWTKGKIKKKGHNFIPNGILYLKGGDLSEELSGIKGCTLFPLNIYFKADFFDTKKVVHLPIAH
jgi:16S rRNA (guanine527-N7)-methyltransferase